MRRIITMPDRAHARSGPYQRRPRSHLLLLAATAGLVLMNWADGVSPTTAAPQMVHAAPKAYVALNGGNAVAVIDTATNRLLKTIAIPAGPEGVAASPDGLRVYASSAGASTVSVISTLTDRVVSSIDVGKAPHNIAMTRDGRHLLVAVWGASQVAVVDTVRNEVIARIPVGNPHTIAISPDGRNAYVTAQQPGAAGLAILDLAMWQRVGMVPLDKTPRALNFSPDGSTLYFTLAGVDAVQVLDVETNQIVAHIPTGASPHHPLFVPNGKYALVVVQGPGQLAVINPTTREIIGTVPVDKFPHWVATTADSDTAYVTNEGAGTVTVVNIETQQVLTTIPVGAGPRKIVIQPMPGPKAQRLPTVYAVTGSVLALAGPVPAAAAPGGGRPVQVANFAFTPAALTVVPGDTIIWTNTDGIPHTTTSADKQWDSGPIQPGASFVVTLTKPGTYRYGCTIHPFMQATLVVGN